MKYKYKNRIEKGINTTYEVSEIYDVNVIDHLNRDLGKCYLVEIWQDEKNEIQSYYILKNKNDAEYLVNGNGVGFLIANNTIKFNWTKK